MGLLTKIASRSSIGEEFGDDARLLHGLMLMAGADGVIEDSEWNTLRQYWCTLPEFKGKDFQQVYGQAQKILNQFPSLQESVKALSGIENETLRNKLFVIAADLAMSSGDVDHNEDQLLESMQRVMNISNDLATQILEVLAIKYAK